MVQQDSKQQHQNETTNRHCVFQKKHTFRCLKNNNACDYPDQHIACPSYQPKPSNARSPLYAGTKIGECDICKATKEVLCLKYGFTLCENCLTICAAILDQLLINQKTPPKSKATGRQDSKPQTMLNEV
ncbi:MAG: hypothetical protein NWE93_06140 [Candidatus Bathyarchaeota archaeon]|nr:hypothetical protein [Candidatus Bathyarchaeota archaeon]